MVSLKYITRLVCDYRSAKIVFTAASLDIFTHITQGCDTLSKICDKLNLDRRACEIFLNSLVSIGFLLKRGEKYKNSKLSDTYLVSGKQTYVGDNLKYQNLIWDSWAHLEDSLRVGKPYRGLISLMNNSKNGFLENYIKGIKNISQLPAKILVNKVHLKNPCALLDVGAGHGAYTAAFLKKHPHLKADLLDLPEVVKLIKNDFSDLYKKGRIGFIEGNYVNTPVPQNCYDIVLLSHVTHNEGEHVNKKLIRKSFQALRKGGKIIIHDFMLEKDMVRPLFPALFSVHMLVCTKQGRIYSRQEYECWLRDTGFERIEYFKINKKDVVNSNVIVSSKEAE